MGNCEIAVSGGCIQGGSQNVKLYATLAEEIITVSTTDNDDVKAAMYVDDAKIYFPPKCKKRTAKKVMNEVINNMELAGQTLGHGKDKDGYLSDKQHKWLEKEPIGVARRKDFTYLGFNLTEDSSSTISPQTLYSHIHKICRDGIHSNRVYRIIKPRLY
jgi:hypothetical protein